MQTVNWDLPSLLGLHSFTIYNPPLNPSSISSLTAHCLRLPNPGDKFMSIEETLQIIREEMELRRAEMRGWFSKLLAPLSKLKLDDD